MQLKSQWLNDSKGRMILFALLTILVSFSILEPCYSYSNSSKMKFIWLGVTGGDVAGSNEPLSDTEFYQNHQFSKSQIIQLAENYEIVVIDKFHAYGEMALQLRDAQRLKELNPALKVLVCVDGIHVFDKSEFKPEIDQHEEWYLHGIDGNRIPYKDFGWWMDLSNPDLRNGFLQFLAGYILAEDAKGNALLDGIAFDDCYLFNLEECRQTHNTGCDYATGMGDMVGDSRLLDWEIGLKTFLAEAKSLFEKKVLIFNGIGGFPWAYKRSLELLDPTDGALNEQFGFVGTEMSAPDMVSYVKIMSDFPTKIFLEKVNLPIDLSGSQLTRALRKTFGYFMLGYQPGRSYYKAGTGYSVSRELISDPEPGEIAFDFGSPASDFTVTPGGLFRRDFENGMVLLNYRYAALPFVADSTIQLLSGKICGPVFRSGQQVTIAPDDAWFFKFVSDPITNPNAER